MKGKYSGRHMTIYGYILPRTKSIAYSAFLAESLTEEAKYRIRVLDWHKIHGNNVSLTARRFGLGRSTVHRWLKRMRRSGVIGLNDRSRRPKRTRAPITSSNTVMRVVQLRKQYPAWSKYKIRVLLKREGIETSISSVGRILKRRGLIDKKISRRRKNAALRPKARFPKGLRITSAGDMVQMDTKYIMLPGGKKFFQFTAIDVLTKIRVLRVYPSESSRNGAHFLQEVLLNMPFPVKAVQTDNGSCFQKEFEKECQKMNLPHYFIHPRTPKENTYVERSHGSDKKEFYLQGNVSCLLPAMQEKIREWERVWNNVRPHEALGQLAPLEYFSKIQGTNLPTKSIIILQA